MDELKLVEGILAKLDIEHLKALSKEVIDNDPMTYSCGNIPLLNYPLEALQNFASTAYEIIKHSQSIGFRADVLNGMNKQQYVDMWSTPHKEIYEWIEANAEEHRGSLKNAVTKSNYRETDEICLKFDYYNGAAVNIHNEREKYELYQTIDEFLEGNTSFSSSLHELLTNCFSPVKKYGHLDAQVSRVIEDYKAAIKRSNKEISKLISGLASFKDQCDSRKRFLKISPADIRLLERYKHRLDATEWSIITQALSNRMVTREEKKLFNKHLNHITEALSILGNSRDILSEASKTKHLLSDTDKAAAAQLLGETVDWDLTSKRIIKEYIENKKTCLSSMEYAAICDEIRLCELMLDFIQPLITAKKYTTLSNTLSPYTTLAQDKTESSGKSLVVDYPKVHAVTTKIAEAFIRCFVAEVERAYNALIPEGIFDLEDEAFEKTGIINLKYDEEMHDRKKIEGLLAEKGFSKFWFDDYKDISIHLSSCLMISLCDTPADVFYDFSGQTHGAIIGMIHWAISLKKHLDSQLSGTQLSFDFTELARDLRKEIQYYTLLSNSVDYMQLSVDKLEVIEGQSAEYAKFRFLSKPSMHIFGAGKMGQVKVCPPPPLPTIKQISKASANTSSSTPVIPVVNTDDSFNITKEEEQNLKWLTYDTIITDFEVEEHSKEKINSLVPIEDGVLNSWIRSFTFGQRDKGVLYDGNMLVHIDDNKYIKILPKLPEGITDGYATYTFTAIDWSKLDYKIRKLSELIRNEGGNPDLLDEVRDRNKVSDCEPTLLKQLEHRIRKYKIDTELLAELLEEANSLFTGSDKADLVSKIARTNHFGNFKIPQHYLAAWVYYPADYMKIVNPPLDNQGNFIKHEVHHINGNKKDCSEGNIRIITKRLNAALTNRSISVLYNNRTYISISDYCKSTSIKSEDYLRRTIKCLGIGNTVTYNGRDYTMSKSKQLTVTDSVQTNAKSKRSANKVVFNGNNYNTSKDFAKAAKISYDSFRQALNSAKRAGKKQFKHKGLNVILCKDDSIKITS